MNRLWRTRLAAIAVVVSIAATDGALAQRDRRDRDPETVAPEEQARRLALQASVIIEFTITAEGTVKDAVVVESTDSTYNEAALIAISRWRYNPKMENGQAVERRGVRTRLTFQLED